MLISGAVRFVGKRVFRICSEIRWDLPAVYVLVYYILYYISYCVLYYVLA
jgi:hypothetical protein